MDTRSFRALQRAHQCRGGAGGEAGGSALRLFATPALVLPPAPGRGPAWRSTLARHAVATFAKWRRATEEERLTRLRERGALRGGGLGAAEIAEAAASVADDGRSALDAREMPVASSGSVTVAAAANNDFFEWQRATLARSMSDSLAGVPEWAEFLVDARAAGRAFLRHCGMSDDAAAKACRGPVVAWASVHGAGSSHPVHIHADAIVSGVWYPDDAASPLVLLDPRGRPPRQEPIEGRLGERGACAWPVPPFAAEHAVLAKAGETVLFPGWLPHRVDRVPPSAAGRGPRVSIAFNVVGDLSAAPAGTAVADPRPPAAAA